MAFLGGGLLERRREDERLERELLAMYVEDKRAREQDREELEIVMMGREDDWWEAERMRVVRAFQGRMRESLMEVWRVYHEIGRGSERREEEEEDLESWSHGSRRRRRRRTQRSQ